MNTTLHTNYYNYTNYLRPNYLTTRHWSFIMTYWNFIFMWSLVVPLSGCWRSTDIQCQWPEVSNYNYELYLVTYIGCLIFEAWVTNNQSWGVWGIYYNYNRDKQRKKCMHCQDWNYFWNVPKDNLWVCTWLWLD